MFHPIYIMAAVTSVVALAVWGGLLWQICPRDDRRSSILLLLLLGFVMSPAAFYGVRVPLLIGPLEPILKQPEWGFGKWSVARDIVRISFAPLTEEPAKLVPWLVLLAAGLPLLPTRRMIAALALATGLGFAIGEIWLVAGFVAQANDPKLAALPWYSFGGFLSERLMTCITHALFALPTIVLSRRGWTWGALGLALGMLMHGISNAPITLMHRGTFGWKPEVWQGVIQVWLIVLTVWGLIAVIGAYAGRKMLRRLWANKMICPGCGAIYRQPLFMGLNFGMSRYERCGVCHKWHWVTLKNVAPLKESNSPPA
ncbi:MAG TPA: hypothetical protein VGH74_06250 [Planctomycetaceae bacterium]|jgi:hypothetical protein